MSKYRLTKDVESQNWKQGDIINIVGKFVNDGTFEEVSEDTEHQHNLIVVDPITLSVNLKQ